MIYRFTFVLVLFSFFISNLRGQVYINGETVTYKYFIGTSEPSADWNKSNFDDSSWQQGAGSIGFGENAKTQLTKFSGSLYLRIPYQIDDLDSINELISLTDFDDAIVIFANGKEVIRTNLGKKGDLVPYNRLSDRSHEACLTRKYDHPLLGYAIDKTTVNETMIVGNNVLAVQICNDSVNGGDMFFTLYLYNYFKELFDLYDISFHYFQQLDLDSSKLPIVELNTDEFSLPLLHTEYMANMKIRSTEGKYNKLSDAPVFDGNVTLERRGQSSSWFPKWCMNVETKDNDGESLDTSVMGMPRDNDWVLFSDFADRSLMRTELAFYLGRKMGHYEPRTKYCDLVFNGQYQGLYFFMEKIKRGKNRVKITKSEIGLSPENTGYIFRYDKPNGALQYVYPKDDEITQSQKDYLKNYLNEFYAVLKTPKVIDSIEGYKKYINTKSLIDYLVVNELSKNADAYLYSTYMYKDAQGKINYGPLWDFDLAFGNTKWQDGHKTTGWQFSINKVLKIHLIMADTEFVKAFSSRWKELRNSYLATNSLFHTIDSIAQFIEPSRINNYKIWHNIDINILNQPFVVSSYDEEILKLKEYIQARAEWIDQNIDNIYFPLPTGTEQLPMYSKKSLEISPNPCFDYLKITLTDVREGEYKIRISDISGRITLEELVNSSNGETQELTFNGTQILSLKKGLYLVTVLKGGTVVASDKFIKSSR